MCGDFGIDGDQVSSPGYPGAGDAWKMAYDMIKLENDLINHRLTSLLATNAFLFAGLYTLMQAFKDVDSNRYFSSYFIWFMLGGVILLGLMSSYIIGKGVRAASRQINHCASWLELYGRIDAEPRSAMFPSIVGKRSSFVVGYIELAKVVISDVENVLCSLFCLINKGEKCESGGRLCSMINGNDGVINECLEEAYYDDCHSVRDVDDVSSLSAGAIYFPQLLFLVWLLILVISVFCFVCSRDAVRISWLFV